MKERKKLAKNSNHIIKKMICKVTDHFFILKEIDHKDVILKNLVVIIFDEI